MSKYYCFLNTIIGASADFFASAAVPTRENFISFLKNTLNISDDEKANMSIIVDEYLTENPKQKEALRPDEVVVVAMSPSTSSANSTVLSTSPSISSANSTVISFTNGTIAAV
jgi:hypothetical protein